MIIGVGVGVGVGGVSITSNFSPTHHTNLKSVLLCQAFEGNSIPPFTYCPHSISLFPIFPEQAETRSAPPAATIAPCVREDAGRDCLVQYDGAVMYGVPPWTRLL
jgi:hypothetical protein